MRVEQLARSGSDLLNGIAHDMPSIGAVNRASAPGVGPTIQGRVCLSSQVPSTRQTGVGTGAAGLHCVNVSIPPKPQAFLIGT
ncbi:hypothetical protein UVI_02012110 [Ustilaginoidea virens]|uniref:Uncharacterized protein n=1 Tax=Ustilaginoidea virens TaxID=1159556 RepID=A0A1B5L0H1_USTVR|nr:hypothetical protein UVI_02012110 [Ustilaginoidea virens]